MAISSITNSIEQPTPGHFRAANGVVNIVTAPFGSACNAIDSAGKLPAVASSKTPDDSWNIKETATRLGKFFLSYHRNILVKGSEWSGSLERGTEKLFNALLSPLSCLGIHKSFIRNISQKIGYLVRIVSFAAIQILHTIPYVAAAAIIGGSILLYHSSPVALLVTLSAGVLGLQLFFIYKLIEGVKATNNTLGTATDAKEGLVPQMGASIDNGLAQARVLTDTRIENLEKIIDKKIANVEDKITKGLSDIRTYADDYFTNQFKKLGSWLLTPIPIAATSLTTAFAIAEQTGVINLVGT